LQNQVKSIWSQWYNSMETNHPWDEKNIERKIASKSRIVVRTNLLLEKCEYVVKNIRNGAIISYGGILQFLVRCQIVNRSKKRGIPPQIKLIYSTVSPISKYKSFPYLYLNYLAHKKINQFINYFKVSNASTLCYSFKKVYFSIITLQTFLSPSLGVTCFYRWKFFTYDRLKSGEFLCAISFSGWPYGPARHPPWIQTVCNFKVIWATRLCDRSYCRLFLGL